MSILNRLRWFKQRLTLGKPYELSFRQVVAREYQFYAQYIKEGMTIIDVGAHTGETMAIFSRLCGPTGHVYCYEPIPPTFERLTDIIELMGKDNVSAFPVALTDQPGAVVMEYRGFSQSSLSRMKRKKLRECREASEARQSDRDCARFYHVPGDTLDHLIEEHGIEFVDLLKIDVEGCELDVLEGASAAFAKKRVGCCVFEFGGFPGDKESEIEGLSDFFRSAGYGLENVAEGYPAFQKRKWDRRRFAMLVARRPA